MEDADGKVRARAAISQQVAQQKGGFLPDHEKLYVEDIDAAIAFHGPWASNYRAIVAFYVSFIGANAIYARRRAKRVVDSLEAPLRPVAVYPPLMVGTRSPIAASESGHRISSQPYRLIVVATHWA